MSKLFQDRDEQISAVAVALLFAIASFVNTFLFLKGLVPLIGYPVVVYAGVTLVLTLFGLGIGWLLMPRPVQFIVSIATLAGFFFAVKLGLSIDWKSCAYATLISATFFSVGFWYTGLRAKKDTGPQNPRAR